MLRLKNKFFCIFSSEIMNYQIQVINDSIFNRLPVKDVKSVINNVFSSEGVQTAEISVIYLDSDKMERLNNEYLNHEGSTDVITFSLEEDYIDGEVYICPEVAQDQAKEYNCTFKSELLRLAAHGALHLCGYDDDTTEKREIMNKLETKYISI